MKLSPRKRSLIFSPEHVEWIRSGHKTETRRLVPGRKPQPAHPRGEAMRVSSLPPRAGVWCRPVSGEVLGSVRFLVRDRESAMQHFPQSQVIPLSSQVRPLGTLLYSREKTEYRMVSGGVEVRYPGSHEVITSPLHPGYRQTDWTTIRARHSPFFASRCMMELTHVRHEVLGEISDDSIRREGYADRAAFEGAWDRLHGPGSFERHQEDTVEVLTFECLDWQEFFRLRDVIMGGCR